MRLPACLYIVQDATMLQRGPCISLGRRKRRRDSPWPQTFLVYINDLPSVCKSSQANMFADDTLLYRHIRNYGDSIKLQGDLTALEDWESKLQMSLHPEKCNVLRIKTSKGNRRELFPPWSTSQTAPNILV